MAAAIELKGLCWDHPRCTAPMTAAAKRWQESHPDVTVSWAARPLAAFNDQPVAVAARGYDLVFIDHPMVAQTAPTGCLRPLDDLVPAARLDELAVDSIAGSHDSYAHAGHQWALAVDAACQVAVTRETALDRLGAPVPRTWPDVLELARQSPGAVALPLYPSDAIIAVLSLSAGECAAAGLPRPAPLITEYAVELFVELVARVRPACFELNPPALLDLMAGGGPAYAPLVFGYCTYQRPGRGGRRLRFRDIPTFGAGPAGTVLGGAGLAVTAECRRPAEAAEFASWIAGRAGQRDVVCGHDGQPASAGVWSDPTADELVGGFFTDTRATIDRGYVRPSTPWWPRFQAVAGVVLVELLRSANPPDRVHTALVDLLDRHRADR